jgi:hypothetical protein
MFSLKIALVTIASCCFCSALSFYYLNQVNELALQVTDPTFSIVTSITQSTTGTVTSFVSIIWFTDPSIIDKVDIGSGAKNFLNLCHYLLVARFMLAIFVSYQIQTLFSMSLSRAQLLRTHAIILSSAVLCFLIQAKVVDEFSAAFQDETDGLTKDNAVNYNNASTLASLLLFASIVLAWVHIQRCLKGKETWLTAKVFVVTVLMGIGYKFAFNTDVYKYLLGIENQLHRSAALTLLLFVVKAYFMQVQVAWTDSMNTVDHRHTFLLVTVHTCTVPFITRILQSFTPSTQYVFLQEVVLCLLEFMEMQGILRGRTVIEQKIHSAKALRRALCPSNLISPAGREQLEQVRRTELKRKYATREALCGAIAITGTISECTAICTATIGRLVLNMRLGGAQGDRSQIIINFLVMFIFEIFFSEFALSLWSSREASRAMVSRVQPELSEQAQDDGVEAECEILCCQYTSSLQGVFTHNYAAIMDMVNAASKANKLMHIAGYIQFDQKMENCTQYIEGNRKEMEFLIGSIFSDQRHAITMSYTKQLPHRTLKNWGMEWRNSVHGALEEEEKGTEEGHAEQDEYSAAATPTATIPDGVIRSDARPTVVAAADGTVKLKNPLGVEQARPVMESKSRAASQIVSAERTDFMVDLALAWDKLEKGKLAATIFFGIAITALGQAHLVYESLCAARDLDVHSVVDGVIVNASYVGNMYITFCPQ